MDIRETPPCPVCASDFTVFIQEVRGNRTGRMISQFCCLDCRSFYNPSGYSEDDAQKRNDFEFLRQRQDSLLALQGELMLDLVARVPHCQTVLEVGCGAGFLLKSAENFGRIAVGYDVNPYAIEHARSVLGVDARCEILTEETPGRYDLVVTVGVLEHLEFPRGLFSLMRSKLNPHGAIYANVPFIERQQWPFLLTANENPASTPPDIFYDNDVHITHFSRDGLEKLGRDNGARRTEYFVSRDVAHNSTGAYPGILFYF